MVLTQSPKSDEKITTTTTTRNATSELLDTSLSKVYTHVHPILILAIYYMKFPQLVENPIKCMTNVVPYLIVVQALWCILCLPPAGSTSKKGGPKTRKGIGAFKGNDAQGKMADDVQILDKIVPTLLSLLLTQISIPPVTALHILMGAPLTTHLPHTMLCATHISILAVFPLIYIHGADPVRWLEVAGLNSNIEEVFAGSVGTLVGGWLGAIPIPLDWDREWQKWPVTILIGAVLGYCVGKGFGILFRGRKISLD